MDSKVDGFAELRTALEQLKTNVARAALRTASRKAGEVVRKAAIQRAPVGSKSHRTYKGRIVAPGYLSRTINIKTSYRTRTGVLRVSIGPGKEAFYGSQFLEVGTSKIPKQPWLVPALEDSQQAVIDTFSRELRNAINKAVRKGGKR